MLHVNQTFKNYKELCAYINQPVHGGNAKRKQVANWEHYFTFETDKQKYIITSVVRDDIKEIPEDTEHTNSIWNKHISNQLCNTLLGIVSNPDQHTNKYGLYSLVLTTQEAFQAVGLVNEEFHKLSWDASEDGKPTTSIIFYKAASKKLYDIFYKVITTLDTKKILQVHHTYLLYISRNSKVVRVASEEETDKINAQTRALLDGEYARKPNEHGIVPANSLFLINFRGLNRVFYKNLGTMLEKDGIYYARKVYRISFLQGNLEYYQKQYLLTEAQLKVSKGILNAASYAAIREVIEKNITTIPVNRDFRTLEERINNPDDFDKSEYFELLEYTIPLVEEEDDTTT